MFTNLGERKKTKPAEREHLNKVTSSHQKIESSLKSQLDQNKIELKPARNQAKKVKVPPKTWGEVATPFLRIDAPKPWFNRNEIKLPKNKCNVTVTVKNEGNAPSYFTVVDLLEGPFMSITPDRIKNCELRDRKILTIYPGEEKKVTLEYTRKNPKGQAIGICYDPFLDPKPFENGIGFGAFDRKNILHAVRY